MSNSASKKKKPQAKKKQGGGSRRWVRYAAAALAGLLAVLMLVSVFSELFYMRAAGVTQSTVSSLKDKLSSTTDKKKQLQEELKLLANDKTALKKQIEKVDQQIEAAEEEIELQEQLISELGKQIEVKTEELVASQAKEDDQYEKMRMRVRLMVEQGNLSYLNILLSADDFSDFLARYEVVNQVSSYDRQLFEDLKALKEQIAEQKTSLETDKADAEILKTSMDENKKALDQDLANRKQRMKALETAEDETKAAFAQIEEEEKRVQDEINKAMAELAKKNSTYVGGTFLWPLPAGYTNITCPYGMRNHPITGKRSLHTGTDISAPKNTKIFAANGGTVITSGYSAAYGNYVVIDHGGGVSTLYGHMTKRAVSKGQKVSRGDVIGYVGSTGYSTGNHLHFQVQKNGSTYDVMTEFKKA